MPGSKAWDLILVEAYTAAASGAVLSLAQGQLWAVLVVLFAPGYVLVAALFPSRGLEARLRALAEEGDELQAAAQAVGVNLAAYRGSATRAEDAAQHHQLVDAVQLRSDANDRLRHQLEERASPDGGRHGLIPPRRVRAADTYGEIDWPERIALSVGVSIAITALLVLALDLTPWGIHLDGIVAILLAFTLGVGAAAYWRRGRLPEEDRLIAGGRFPRPTALPYSPVDKALVVALGASLIVAATVVGYVALSPRPVEQFTQLYLLNANGTTTPSGYPTRLNVSQPAAVYVVVVNNESSANDYKLQVDLVGVQVILNATSGLNETFEVNRSALATYQLSLGPNREWQTRYSFGIASAGIWELDFRLFRGTAGTVYREVYLLIHVVSG